MKTNFMKVSTWAMALCASMAVFTACNDDVNGTTPPPAPSVENLGGIVTENMTLTANTEYKLTSQLQVKAPAVLTIEEGVKITAADSEDPIYILIEQGAKINAVGTVENPIVMTAENKTAGGWGGLHICGYAPTNAGSGFSEIGNAAYGGNDANDNSGVLKYIRLEYTGFALDDEHESNGISFYGVGAGTQVSYVQTYVGADDGLEFFGGTVNVDHCVVVDCTDDSFDWTEGWSGTATNLVAYQTDASCDCLIEADNNGDNFDATPVAHPTLRNLYLVGNGSSENKRGIRLRAGTRANIDGAKVAGKPNPLTIETTQTDDALANGTSVLKNVQIAGVLKNDVTGGKYLSANFLTGQGNAENAQIATTWDDVAGDLSFAWLNDAWVTAVQ